MAWSRNAGAHTRRHRSSELFEALKSCVIHCVGLEFPDSASENLLSSYCGAPPQTTRLPILPPNAFGPTLRKDHVRLIAKAWLTGDLCSVSGRLSMPFLSSSLCEDSFCLLSRGSSKGSKARSSFKSLLAAGRWEPALRSRCRAPRHRSAARSPRLKADSKSSPRRQDGGVVLKLPLPVVGDVLATLEQPFSI